MPVINQIVKGGGGSSVAEPYLEWSVVNGELKSTTSRFVDLSNVTRINEASAGFAYTYYNNTNIVGSVGLGAIQTVAKVNGFAHFVQGCTGITSFDMSNLETVSAAGAFTNFASGCASLASINIKKFAICTGNTCFEYGMENCSSLVTLRFESLRQIKGSAFLRYALRGCSSLKSVWFYALTNVGNSYTNLFDNMFNTSVVGCTVHFPIAIQSRIGSWASVTAGFGGTNTTVLFDIVTTLTGADGNTYTRQEKDSTTTATAWVYNDTLYYTSGVSDNANGVNEPAVGDTIYSDSACTTAVTTIATVA